MALSSSYTRCVQGERELPLPFTRGAEGLRLAQGLCGERRREPSTDLRSLMWARPTVGRPSPGGTRRRLGWPRALCFVASAGGNRSSRMPVSPGRKERRIQRGHLHAATVSRG